MHYGRIIRSILKYWLPLAAVLTAVFAFIYLSVQQDMRMGLNDPQIQMAEDAANALTSNQPVESILPANGLKVDLAKSLAPYLIIYDASGSPVASGAVLNNQVPVPPAGVFDYTRQHNEDRVSWQPAPDVRSAAVIVAVNGGEGGFVLAGRGMREVEIRESQLTNMTMLGWMASLVVTLVMVVFFEFLPFTRA
jgi:hypothetical protein